MAAVLANGKTILRNAAREPEVVDLANFLNSIGAKIEGAGTDEIHITGVAELKGGDCFIPSDRIEAGTYLAAATLTNGCITINKVDPNRLENILSKLRLCGADIKTTKESVSIEMNSDINPVDIQTQPFPRKGLSLDINRINVAVHFNGNRFLCCFNICAAKS